MFMSTDDFKKQKIYFIAEFNTSHFGDLDLAMEMVNKAKEIGANCVKFQSWSVSSLYSRSYYDKNPIAKRFVEKYSLSEEQLRYLGEHCSHIGIDFLSTPYSIQEVDFLLNECEASAVKIASMEVNNLDYLKLIAKTGTSIFLSTGMSSIDEIRLAVDAVLSHGAGNLCLFHCVSQYPTDLHDANILNVKMLRDEFPEVHIGYSDHTLGFEAAMASVALGATVIERHFTLDKSRIGMDNNMACEPNEFRELIKGCVNVQQSLGRYDRIVSEAELEQRKNMRRSVVYAKGLSAGHVLQKKDLDLKRPGDGIPPTDIAKVVGRELKLKVEYDTLVNYLDFY